MSFQVCIPEYTYDNDNLVNICSKIMILENCSMTMKIHTFLVVLGLKNGYLHNTDRLFMYLVDKNYSEEVIDEILDAEHKKLGEDGYFKKYCQGELKYFFDEIPELNKYLGFTQKTRYDCIYNKKMVTDSFFDSKMTDEKYATLFSYLKPFDFEEKPKYVHRLSLNVDEQDSNIYCQLSYEDMSEELTKQYKNWENVIKSFIPIFPGFSLKVKTKL